jgi:hypothetical protein
MSTEKLKKKQWGGWRKGAGAKPRPEGTIKICISLNKKIWHDARRSWSGKASHLVEKLISEFVVKQGESGQNTEAAI